MSVLGDHFPEPKWFAPTSVELPILFGGIKPDAKIHGMFPRNFPLKSVYCLTVGVILDSYLDVPGS